MSMDDEDREMWDREKAMFDAAREILDRACEEILECVYHFRPGPYDLKTNLKLIDGYLERRLDLLSILIGVFCRRAEAIDEDPQQLMKVFWPDDVPWVEGRTTMT